MTSYFPAVTDDKFNKEQKEYIRKYAAGLVLHYVMEHIPHLITPDIGDGFEPPKGLFPDPLEQEDNGEDSLQFEAHGEVCSLVDLFTDELAKLCGYDGGWQEVEASECIGGTKYPLIKGNHIHEHEAKTE